MRVLETIAVGNALGECVVWDDRAGAVWWTDIEGCALYRLDWAERRLQTFATPGRLAAFGLVDRGTALVAAFADGFALYDPWTGRTSGCVKPDRLAPGQRLNDGRVDRRGRFWCAAMEEIPERPAAANLYCLEDGRLSTHLDGIGIGNGLCWSPDGRVCYLADSREAVLWRFDYDGATGILSNRSVFALSAPGACPDGATVDAEGFVWCAQWGGGCVVRYAPDGRIDRVIAVPVTQPTSVAFGGPDLDLLFVTSARHTLPAPQTGAGDLFVYNVPVRGLPESRFRLGAWPETAGILG